MKNTASLVASIIKNQINNTKTNTGASGDANSAVRTALQVVFSVVAIISVVMIIIGGISYTTSKGDPGKVTKAKGTIIYGIIGLIVSLLAFAIVTFVLNYIK